MALAQLEHALFTFVQAAVSGAVRAGADIPIAGSVTSSAIRTASEVFTASMSTVPFASAHPPAQSFTHAVGSKSSRRRQRKRERELQAPRISTGGTERRHF